MIKIWYKIIKIVNSTIIKEFARRIRSRALYVLNFYFILHGGPRDSGPGRPRDTVVTYIEHRDDLHHWDGHHLIRLLIRETVLPLPPHPHALFLPLLPLLRRGGKEVNGRGDHLESGYHLAGVVAEEQRLHWRLGGVAPLLERSEDLLVRQHASLRRRQRRSPPKLHISRGKETAIRGERARGGGHTVGLVLVYATGDGGLVEENLEMAQRREEG